jgi:hypothetical protein
MEAIICILVLLAFSELYLLACTGVGGGEEQDGGDHLHFGLSSLSYIFLPVQVLEEEKSKMEEIICILNCLL